MILYTFSTYIASEPNFPKQNYKVPFRNEYVQKYGSICVVITISNTLSTAPSSEHLFYKVGLWSAYKYQSHFILETNLELKIHLLTWLVRGHLSWWAGFGLEWQCIHKFRTFYIKVFILILFLTGYKNV